MHDQQALAQKPLLLTPKPASIAPPKSPAALQGAVFAFLPKSATPTASVPPTSAGARIAALTAGFQAQPLRGPSPERHHVSTKSLPIRGRHSPASSSVNSRDVETATPLSTSRSPSRPSLQTRSSSTLAAQHASAHSRSPRRSPNRSLQSSTTSIVPARDAEQGKRSTEALSGATASMATSSIKKEASTELGQSVRSIMLNFEKIPILPATRERAGSSDNGSLQPQSLASGQGGLSSRSLSPNPPVTERQNNPHGEGSTLSVPKKVAPAKLDGSPPNGSTAKEVLRQEDAVDLLPDPGIILRRGRSHMDKSTRQESYRDTMTVNDLADAMVASSLASSRAASPLKKSLPPPPPRKRSLSIPVLYETRLVKDREPRKKSERPPRAMKLTLRKQGSSDEETSELVKRGRRHWMRKHPNMHSEGDRKRWRDKITTRERRRYEGVFAANRGLLIGPGFFEPSPNTLSGNLAEGNQVVNIIVRDIWERSRLPREVLREIYDLVSPEEAYALNREQFVVGMWLIDQRLKGRKLPVKVSASVWSSVRHSEGIKIKSRQFS